MGNTAIAQLPAELLLRITEFLSLKDIRNLSVTNIQFRTFLASTLFRFVKATNRLADAEAIEHLVREHGRHVERLRFECHLAPQQVPPEGMQGPDNRETETLDGNGHVPPAAEPHDQANESQKDAISKPWEQPGFSQIAQDLLSGQHLPNLKTVTLVFLPYDSFNGYSDEGDIDWGGAHDIGDGSIYIHERLESDEERIEEERRYQWRKDVNTAFECLSRNALIHHIDFQSLIPKVSSIWLSQEWQAMMGRIEQLDLGLWGGDNGAGWHSSTLEGYTDFIPLLHDHFFHHANNVTNLHFAGNEDSMPGCEGMNHSPLPLHPEDLPKLQHLILEHCIIDPALQSFLRRKSGQLQTLTFLNCFSEASDDGYALADNPITWAQLFRSMVEAQTGLRELQVTNTNIALLESPRDEHEQRSSQQVIDELHQCGAEVSVGGERNVENDEEGVGDVKSVVGGTKRLFAYGVVNDKYGDFMQFADMNIKFFWKGEDQREWDRVMDVVRDNAEARRRNEVMSC